MVLSLILSHFDCCLSIYGTATSSLIGKDEKFQNFAARDPSVALRNSIMFPLPKKKAEKAKIKLKHTYIFVGPCLKLSIMLIMSGYIHSLLFTKVLHVSEGSRKALWSSFP